MGLKRRLLTCDNYSPLTGHLALDWNINAVSLCDLQHLSNKNKTILGHLISLDQYGTFHNNICLKHKKYLSFYKKYKKEKFSLIFESEDFDYF